MPDYAWPDAEHRTLIGKRTTRVDSPVKVSGEAKYTYDVHRPGMLYGKVLRCPYAHAKVVSIDTSAAEKMPGVSAVQIVQGPGSNIHWAGDEIVAVAAVDEGVAEDAIRTITVKYQQLPHLVKDAEPPAGSAQEQGPLSMDDIGDMLDNQVPHAEMVSQIQRDGVTQKPSEDALKKLKDDGAPDEVLAALRSATEHPEAGKRPPSNYQKAATQTTGDPDKSFSEAEVVSEGLYGSSGHYALLSRKPRLDFGVDRSGSCVHAHLHAERFRHRGTDGRALESSRNKYSRSSGQCRRGVRQQVLSRSLGNLHRRNFQESGRQAGSLYAGARRGAEGRRGPAFRLCSREGGRQEGRHGDRLAIQLLGNRRSWWRRHATDPLRLQRSQSRHEHTAIRNNIGPARAWRAPNHPQAAVLTMCALDDLAAKLNMDPVEFFRQEPRISPKLVRTHIGKSSAIATELMGWKEKWHPRAPEG